MFQGLVFLAASFLFLILLPAHLEDFLLSLEAQTGVIFCIHVGKWEGECRTVSYPALG